MEIKYNVWCNVFERIAVVCILLCVMVTTAGAQEGKILIRHDSQTISDVSKQLQSSSYIAANNANPTVEEVYVAKSKMTSKESAFDNLMVKYKTTILILALIVLIFGIVYVIRLSNKNKTITKDLMEKERLLKLKELEMSLSLEAAGIGIIKYDVINNHYYRDENFYKHLGYSHEDLSNFSTGVHNIVHEDDIALLMMYQKQLAGKDYDKTYNVKVRIYKKDGSLATILLLGRLTEFTEDGSPKTIQGVIVDITHKEKMETEKNNLLELLGLALGEYGVSTWKWNKTENCIHYNFFSSNNKIFPLAKKIFSNADTETKLSMKTYGKYIHPDDLEAVKKFTNSYKFISKDAFDKNVQIEHRLVIDGVIYTIYLQGKVVEFGSDGLASRVVGIAHDITDRINKDTNKADTNKLEAIGALAGGVAHDFNNQLNGILGFVDLLKKIDELKDNKLIQRYLNIIEECGSKCEGITSKLLAFAQKGKEKQEVFDLHVAINTMVKMLENTMDRNITISKSLTSSYHTLDGDKNQIENVILNIMLNSCDAMVSGGTIRIETDDRITNYIDKCYLFEKYKDEKVVIIKISDTGKGIEASLLNKIFEPFYTTKQIGEGVGMGLAVVFGVVKDHGGEVYVESEVGVGTNFYLCLPVKNSTTKLDVDGGDINNIDYNNKNLGTILVVDDEMSIRVLLKNYITSFGCKVIIAKNGQEAVDIYEEMRDEISLVISDISMPLMSGPEALLKLKKINKDVKVILITGYAESDDKVVFMLNNGASALLKKPLNKEKLYLGIRNALGQ